MKIEELSIKTTSLCNRMCRNCQVRYWMIKNKNYHTPIEDIKNLIKYSKEAGYEWNYILLSGGEPLLWKNLEEGARLLWESGITGNIKILTNGIAASPKTIGMIGRILKHVHHFRVSRYSNNARQIEYLRLNFGNRIEVEDRTVHIIPPDAPVPDSLPAHCSCKAYALVHGRVDLCGPARCILYMIGENLNNEGLGVELKPYFMNDLFKRSRYDRKACSLCISNTKVAAKQGRTQS